uniref:Trans-2,3-enoyl-CoA reductase-like 2b n=1 Tax=Cyprinus carpio TaxID=7962 RepID=A0A8C1ZZA4_CYPCA
MASSAHMDMLDENIDSLRGWETIVWHGFHLEDWRRHGVINRVIYFKMEILDPKSKAQLCYLDKVHFAILKIPADPKFYPSRQSLKLHPEGKALSDDDVLEDLPVGTTATMFFQDLGPQLGWTMVFLEECLGPLFIYLPFYYQLPYIYGHEYVFTRSPFKVLKLASWCHSLHYFKRLVETSFIHRFSDGTLPLRTFMVLCLYYWGFAAWQACYINHPLYTPPTYGRLQIYSALAMFLVCEFGNFSVHLILNGISCNGSRPTEIPYPTNNSFTWLFFFMSCPNYTYEVGSWISFTVMTQCVPVGISTFLGFIQMTIWARAKHKTYIEQLKDYPDLRTAIIPFFF